MLAPVTGAPELLTDMEKRVGQEGRASAELTTSEFAEIMQLGGAVKAAVRSVVNASCKRSCKWSLMELYMELKQGEL